jgi:expansin (peptidoglycan-binding protein)
MCSGAWGGSSDGSITWYTFSQGTAAAGDVNCSFGIQQDPDRVNNVFTGAGEYFGAINTADYDTAATCGACVELERVDTGQSVTITIVDQCPIATNPKCVAGHIDLSQAAFQQLGDLGAGYLGQRAGVGQITWKYVSCPTSGNVKFRLKEPSNAGWNQVIVEAHRTPVTSVQVQVNGSWVDAVRQAYNFWEPPGGNMGTPPYVVRAIDMNGDSVQGNLALTSGRQDSGQQFSCN